MNSTSRQQLALDYLRAVDLDAAFEKGVKRWCSGLGVPASEVETSPVTRELIDRGRPHVAEAREALKHLVADLPIEDEDLRILIALNDAKRFAALSAKTALVKQTIYNFLDKCLEDAVSDMEAAESQKEAMKDRVE